MAAPADASSLVDDAAAGVRGAVLVPVPRGRASLWAPAGALDEAAFILDEIFAQDVYGVFEGPLCVFPGCTVVDVGANTGAFVAALAALLGEGAAACTVHCVEPIPATAALLRANVARLGLAHCVRVHTCACGRGDGGGSIGSSGSSGSSGAIGGEAQFVHFPRAPGNSVRAARAAEWAAKLRPPLAEGAREVTCKTTTVSALLRAEGIRRIDLLKIDVEGDEEDVLEGIAMFDWPKVAQIAVEVHRVGDRIARIACLLCDRGFTVSCAGGSAPGAVVLRATRAKPLPAS